MRQESELLEELKSVFETLGELPKGDPNLIIGDLSYCAEWLARASVLEAEAKEILDIKRSEIADRHPDANATRLRLILDAQAASQAKLYNLAHNLRSALLSRSEALRSLLSYEKSLLAAS